MDFEARKLASLQAMASRLPDRSRKGSVDAPIAPLISRINAHPAFFTTSSCSGRISISRDPQFIPPQLSVSSADSALNEERKKKVEESAQKKNQATQDQSSVGKNDTTKEKKRKKGGDWSYVSHDEADEEELVRTVLESCARSLQDDEHQQHDKLGLMVFRFEPFILAVECVNLEAAQALVSCAISSGFRESGVTSMKKRIIAAVRCSIRIEAPIAEKGRLLVDEAYLRFLVRIANKKMAANLQRTDRFLSTFIDQMEGPTISESTGEVVRRQLSSLSIYREANSCYSGEKSNAKTFQIQRRKLADLEKRQTRVLSRVHELETKLQELFPDTSRAIDAARFETLEGMEKSSVVQVQGLVETKSFPDSLGYVDGASEDFQTNGVVANSSSGSVRIQEDAVDLEKADVQHEAVRTGLQSCSQRTEQDLYDLEGKGRVRGEMLKKLDDFSKKLSRWGHSTCLLPEACGIGSTSLLIFGGYGGTSRQGRQNDLLMLDCHDGKLQSICTESQPAPRMGHTASIVGQKMVVIGGRENPSKPLGDVYVLDLNNMQWMYPAVRGTSFPPRHRHAAINVGLKIYVFGGLDDQNALGDLQILDTSIMQWSQIECAGDLPAPRHSHSLSVIDQKLYLFGGFDGRQVLGDLSVLDLESFVWSTMEVNLSARFSHTISVVDRTLLLLGGCPLTKHTNAISLLNVDTMEWRHERIRLPSDCLFVRHSATRVRNQLVIVGGGISCYAFGTKFSPPFLMSLTFVLPDIQVMAGEREGTLAKHCLEEMSDNLVWVVKTDKVHAKLCKDTLKQLGWLDLRRKASVDDDGLHVLFPIVKEALCHLEDRDGTSVLRFPINVNQLKDHCDVLTAENIPTLEIVQMKSVGDLKFPKAPREVLEDAIFLLLQKYGLPTSLLLEIPKRWEQLDDMAILPSASFASDTCCSLGLELWMTVAKSLNVSRIARQAPVKATSTRDSNLQILLGDTGWVHHRENGILYCFDVSKCMFSSGNVSEKLRMARINCSGEIIVDLFAGIGYSVLPFLLKANAKRVYACEWNPPALHALRYNLRANMVEDRCTVLEGDNRITAPQGLADRVCLGLLPTSEQSWEVAVKALRCKGGILHIHGNVKDAEEKQWADYVCTSIKQISESQGCQWTVHVAHIERVKWYAPHIRHLVVDVKCKLIA